MSDLLPHSPTNDANSQPALNWKFFESLALRAAVAALILIGTFILIVGYWLVYPYDVMQIKTIHILTHTVEVGELMEYRMDYCKSQQFANLNARVQHSFTDELIHNMPSEYEYGPLPPGCTSTVIALIVPPVPPGIYKLGMTREYKVNLMRTVMVSAVSDVFKVTNKKRLEQMLKSLPEPPLLLPKGGLVPDVAPR